MISGSQVTDFGMNFATGEDLPEKLKVEVREVQLDEMDKILLESRQCGHQ